MQSIKVNGGELAYDVSGDGEPVLFIHGAIIADALRPLADQPSLATYQRIVYHRSGYGQSTGSARSVVEHAADAAALLKHLDLGPAHVIGHSYGGSTAVQLAVDAPALVRSLSLLEPGLFAIPSGDKIGAGLAAPFEAYASGDKEGGVNKFARIVMGPNALEYAASVSSDALPQAYKDVDTMFTGDLASLGEWPITKELAGRIEQPVLLVVGSESGRIVREGVAESGADFGDTDMFAEMADVYRSWIPQTELTFLDGLNHALQMQNAKQVAEAVAPFLAKAPTPA